MPRLVAVVLLALVSVAAAHDGSILNGRRNHKGEYCCGKGDCSPVTVRYHTTLRHEGDEQWTVTGYAVQETREFVLESEALLSPDGNAWRCKHPNGSLRCLFVPPQVF